MESLGNQEKAKSTKSMIKWRERWANMMFFAIAVISSPAVWATWIGHWAYGWGCYAFFTTIPSFMKQVLFLDIQANGLVSSIPYITLWLTCIVSGFIADHVLIEKKLLSIKSTRKVYTGTGLIGPGLVILLLWFTDCRRSVLAVVIFTVGVALTGLSTSGWIANYNDIAKDYSGVLYSVGNTVCALTGYLAPTVFGLFTRESQSHTAWALAYTLTAAILFFGVRGSAFSRKVTNSPGQERKENEKQQKQDSTLRRMCKSRFTLE